MSTLNILETKNTNPIDALKQVIAEIETNIPSTTFYMNNWERCVIGRIIGAWDDFEMQIITEFFGIKLPDDTPNSLVFFGNNMAVENEDDDSYFRWDENDWKIIRLFTIDITPEEYNYHRMISSDNWLIEAKRTLAELEK